jgi:acyl-CoA synthetase (AMP-forming)/AMP-acid ligase II
VNVSDIPAREARRHGSRVAVVDATTGRSVTFAELERRVDALARRLGAEPEISRGDRISVLAYNCIEYVELVFGAARAGLIVQGLNWRLATDELERILRDADPRVLVAGAEVAGVADELERRVAPAVSLRLGDGGTYDDFVESGAESRPRPAAAPNAADPVMIIYTGGSSGEPKGAVHTNRSVIAAMTNNTIAERIVPSDRYLMLGQMFHSASVLALNYLMQGATLVLVPRFDARLALEVMEAERITTSLAFPAMIHYMLEEADRRRFELGTLRNLQYGGGPIAPRVIEAMMDALPCTLIQCYGSTEHVAVAFLSQEDHLAGRTPEHRGLLRTCGREAFLTRMRLLGSDRRPVPWDGRSLGEIFVDSPANMAGYWRRPDLTEKATSDGWLGTGDLATADERGYFTVVDRLKDVIVSGGENIYAAQVENAIAALPGVLEVAVVGVPHELWGEAVKAFVVLRAGREVSQRDVQDAVRDSLGSYQKPQAVEFMAELPKSSAGKVAKSELRGAEPSAWVR